MSIALMQSWWPKAVRAVALLSLLLLMGAIPSAARPVGAQTSPPVRGPSCGWNGPLNGGGTVASSPAGSDVEVTIGEPSWQQDCFSFPGNGGSTSGMSLPAYEVFPVTVQAAPGATFTLQAGRAVPSAQQISQDGVRNTTIWAWFDPSSVVTDSNGVGKSNLTLVGAVMPFVPNDISNVSLPISAVTAGGTEATAALPIEFTGGGAAGVTVLSSPGPLSFGAGLEGQAGQPTDPLFSLVYSPAASAATASPLSVSLKVLGTYDNRGVGPMPSDVQVSFPQPNFELSPNSVFYFPIAENNTLRPSNVTQSADYVFAVQEEVGNSTYVVPLDVSISLMQVFAGGTPLTSGTGFGASSNMQWANVPLLIAVAATAVGACIALVVLRRRASKREEAGRLVVQV